MAPVATEIAPLNYERWAVIVSPMVSHGGLGVRPGSEARHTEQLVQIAPSLGRLDSRKHESLIEQTLKPPEVVRKTTERKRTAPPVTSHPQGLILRQPLPDEIFSAAGNLPAPLPQDVAGLYATPETPERPGLDVTS